MDQDPELDVTLSDGRRVAMFQIAAVAEARETWAVVEPGASPRVIRGNGAALAARQRLDARIAARLAAGWVPVDRRSAGAPRVPPAPLAPDLVLLISSLLEALARARSALQAADPSGQLWAERFPLGRSNAVAAMPSVVRAFVWSEEAERGGDQTPDLLKAPRTRGA